MSEEIKTSFVADDKEMLAAYRRMMKEIEGYKKKLTEQTKAHKDEEAAAKAAAKSQEEAAKQAAKATEKAAKDKAAAEKAAAQAAIAAAKEASRAQEKAAKDAERAATAAVRLQAKAVREAAREAAKAQKEAAREGADQMIMGLSKMAAGWLSIQTAIRLATSEYDNYLERQNEAANETLSTADAQLAFFRNLGNVSKDKATQIQGGVRQIAAANNTTESRVYNVASVARSSQGALTDEQMFANVGMALRLAPDSQEQAVALASALNASTRLTGSTNPAENAGLLLGIGEQTRIDNLAQIAKTLLPAATGIKATLPSTSTEEAMALLSTLTTVSEDETGSISGTAGLQLAEQLKEVKSGKKTIRTGTDLGDAIAALQGDEKKRKAFMDAASFDVKAKPFIEQLLTPGTAAARLYAQNLAKVPTGQRAIEQTEQFFENVGTAQYQGVSQASRLFSSATSGLQLQDQAGATSATVRKGLDEALKASGQSAFMRFGYNRFFDVMTTAGQDPREVAAGLLQERADTIRGIDPNERGTTSRATPEGEVVARKLDAMIAELRGMRMDNKTEPKKKNADAHTE